MSLKKRVGSALVATAILAATAACGSDGGGAAGGGSGCEFGPTDDADWSSTLGDAAEEGTVNFHHVFSPDQAKRVIDGFNEVCPDVKVVESATGAALLPPIEQQLESGSDGADVFLWADEGWFKAHADDMAEVSGPSSDAWPEEGWFVPGKVTQAFINTQGFLTWNTQEFPDGFDSFEDLLEPELAGRIGTREDVTTAYIGFLRYMEETYGEQYLPDLAAQDPKFYPSAYVIPQAVASGEVGVANITTVAAVQALKSKGAPIDYVVPDNSYSTSFSLGVLAEAKRPAAAQVLVQYLLSEEGQEAIVGEGEGGSALGVEGALDTSSAYVLDATSLSPEDKEAWTAKFDEIFRGR